jgi:flagellin-specific chaperone FliS
MTKETIQKPVFRGSNELWDGKCYPHITPEIIERLDNLLDFTEPGELREYLLEIYHQYILHEHDSLPCNFKELANSMQVLFDFLKFAHEELIDKRSLSTRREPSDT